MMEDKVLIFGKDECPYTTQAREDYAQKKIAFQYVNVLEDKDAMTQMLGFSKGKRLVPVIVEKGQVYLGYGGGS